jgi:UDP:flavonoid glycosyltransferase YjiC (YdhE family)
MAWELGANFGHLSHLLPVARALRKSGHEILFAVRDSSIAAQLLIPEKFAFVQAPRCQRVMRPLRPLVSYAELLLAEGYGIPSELLGQLTGWIELIRLHRADVVVADHSPTALLAARIAGTSAVALGSGFCIPPEGTPAPSFRPWTKVSDARLASSETRVVRSVNEAMRKLGGKRDLTALADIFDIDARLLATFPELDHYGERSKSVQYVGPIYGNLGAQEVEWLNSRMHRIVAYLRNRTPGLKQLMASLAASDAEVICAFPGITRALADKASSGGLRVLPHAVDLDHLLPRADLMICTAGVATTSQSILAGVPLLMVPTNADQQLLSMRAERVGVALVADGKRDPLSFKKQLRRLVGARECTERTREFARTHAGFNPGTAATAAAEVIERVVAGKRLH